MTRDQQTQWAVQYLAGNLSREEIVDGERSITIQAFADFFAAQWPRTFNKMQFVAQVRGDHALQPAGSLSHYFQTSCLANPSQSPQGGHNV